MGAVQLCGAYSGRFGGLWLNLLKGLFHVAQHGDVDITFGIVTGEGEATVLCSLPIDGEFVCGLEALIKWSVSAFEKYWMLKSST